jgi:Glycosyl transferase family 2
MYSTPKISVLLPVYNAARFLPEALASLAGQTCGDFEVVAVDDGSTDGSGEMLKEFALKYGWLRILHQENSGIAAALNHAFSASQGGLIARMDADDIADQRRLELQSEFLRTHSAIGVCGSWARTFGEGRELVIQAPVTDDAIRSWLIFGSAFVHPAVMMRRDVLRNLDGPYLPIPGAEDYDLWVRLADTTRFYNLPQVLLKYRRHSTQVTQQGNEARVIQAGKVRLDLLTRLGINCSAREQRAHVALGFEPVDREKPESDEVAAWLMRLYEAVPATGWCSTTALRKDCADAWGRYCRRYGRGPGAALAFWRLPLIPHDARSAWRALRLALRR